MSSDLQELNFIISKKQLITTKEHKLRNYLKESFPNLDEFQQYDFLKCCITHINELYWEINNDNISTDNFGNTLLMWAALAGNDKVLDHLLNRSCKAGHKNNFGSNALMFASENGRNSTIGLMLPYLSLQEIQCVNKSGNNAIILAAKQNHPDTVQLLISYFDLNHKNNEGKTFEDYMKKKIN